LRGFGRGLLAPLGAFAGSVLLGAALAGVAILPFLELLHHSSEIGARTSLGYGGHVAPEYLLGVFLPNYWGRPPHTTNYFDTFMADRAFYCGALPLMLAVGALAVSLTRTRWAVALFGAFSMAMVVALPPVFAITKALPGFHTVRTDRMAILFFLAVALLAGKGLDELLRDDARQRTRLITAGVVLLAFPVIWAAAHGDVVLSEIGPAWHLAWGSSVPHAAFASTQGHEVVVKLAALLEWLGFAGAAVALIALRPRLRPTAVGVVALGLAAVDLLNIGMGYNPAIPVSHATQPVTPALRYLSARSPMRFVGVAGEGGDPIPANLAMRYGLYDARGYDFPVERRYAAFWRRAMGTPPSAALGVPGLTEERLHALSMLSVANLMTAPTATVPDRLGLSLAYSGPDAKIYANRRAAPRVFLVQRVRSVDSPDDAMTAIADPEFDARQVAVAEEEIGGMGASRRGPRYAGTARLTDYSPERATVETSADQTSLLVMTDTYFPGWQATVDGRKSAIHRIDYLVRGVVVPAGRHRVAFAYRPASWDAGRALSLAALVALAALAFSTWWRARTAEDAREPVGSA
jgi:Bacterial membrane protein YfhO